MSSPLNPLPLPVDSAGCLYPDLWIGTWSMGGEGFGPHDLALSQRTLELAFDYGIRHFDTAGFYAQGRSEELIFKVFRRKRHRIFISTKGGLRRNGRRVWHDAKPQALRLDLEDSLKRLKTDYLDLFQLHWPDPNVPLDESIDALEKFRHEGLVRFIGVGNLDAKQVLKYILPNSRLFHQVHFNPIHSFSLDILKAGRTGNRCINCIISPFEQGLLVSSEYLTRTLGKKDVRNRNPYFKDRVVRKRVETFLDKCQRENVHPVKAIIDWIKNHDEVDIIIPGPRRPEQLSEIYKAFNTPALEENPCKYLLRS